MKRGVRGDKYCTKASWSASLLYVSVDGTYLESFRCRHCQWGCSRSGWCECPGPPSGGGGACGNRLMPPQVLRRWSAALGFHGTPDQTTRGKYRTHEKKLFHVLFIKVIFKHILQYCSSLCLKLCRLCFGLLYAFYCSHNKHWFCLSMSGLKTAV